MPVTDQMVELAARAIRECVAERHKNNETWDELKDWLRAAYRDEARAALNAALSDTVIDCR